MFAYEGTPSRRRRSRTRRYRAQPHSQCPCRITAQIGTQLRIRRVVTRARDATDRRVVRAKITEAGLRLLDSLDDSIDQTVQRILAHVPKQRLRTLSKLLEEARAGLSG